MNGVKPFYRSLGVMGPVAGLLVMALNTWLFKAQVITEADITELVNLAAGIEASVTGIIGRWRATRSIA